MKISGLHFNARATDLEARADIHSVGTGRQEPASARKIKEAKISEKLGGFANIVLASGGVFCLFVSLYVLYHFGWSGQKQFASRFGIVAYFVFPAVLAALFFLSLRLRRIHKVNIAIFCLSSAISVYGAELFLNYRDTIQNQKRKEVVVESEKQPARFDRRTKLDVIRELRKESIDAVPAVIPSRLLKPHEDGSFRSVVRIDGAEVLPLGGVSSTVTVLCNESGEYAIYKSDKHGFRNPSGTWDLERLDIAAVGDSFAQGACVSSERSALAVIQKSYPATLNLGMLGNGPLFQLATIREYLPPFRPRVVLWFFCEENDLENLKTELNSPLLNRYAKEKEFSQGLLARQTAVDQALKMYINREEIVEIKKELMANPTFYKTLRVVKLSSLREKLGLVYGQARLDRAQTPAIEIAEPRLFGEVLSLAKAAVEAWGGRLYFVYLPSWVRYSGPQPSTDWLGAVQGVVGEVRVPVLRLIEDLDISIIDLHPAFQKEGDPLSLFPLRRFNHYNEAGYRLVAKEVLKTISLDEPNRS